VKLDMFSEYTVFRFDVSEGVFETKRDTVAVEKKGYTLTASFMQSFVTLHHK